MDIHYMTNKDIVPFLPLLNSFLRTKRMNPANPQTFSGFALDERRFCLAAVESAMPSGFLLAEKHPDHLEVLALYVDENKRKKGIATALFHSAVDGAERMGLKTIRLSTKNSDRDARRFIEGLGALPERIEYSFLL